MIQLSIKTYYNSSYVGKNIYHIFIIIENTVTSVHCQMKMAVHIHVNESYMKFRIP